MTARRTLKIIWLVLAFLFIATSLYEGYLVIPGVSNHSVFSILQRAFLILAPAAVIYAIWRGERTGLFSLVVLTGWLIIVGLTFLAFSPHTYYYEYYVWSQIGGYLLVLTLWVLGRYRRWFYSVVMAAIPIYVIATIILSIYEIATAHHLPQSREGGPHPTHIPTAFYYDPNNLGTAIALILPFVVLLGIVIKNRGMVWLSMILSLFMVYVLYKSGSRGGELALIIDLIVLAVVLPRPYRRIAQVLLAAGVLVFAGLIVALQAAPHNAQLPFALQKIAHIVHLFGAPRQAPGPGSVTIREALYLSGWHGLLTHPWGMGPRGAERYYRYWLTHHSPYNTYGIIDAHNMWLEVAMDFGFPGLILYVSFYVSLLIGLIRLLKQSSPWFQYYAAAGLAALIGFILGSLSPSSVMIGFNVMWMVYGISLGAFVLAHHQTTELPRYQFRSKKIF